MAVLAGLGLPALTAAVFLAVAVLTVACWVLGSGDRTNRASQLLRAWRSQADDLAPPASLPSGAGAARRPAGNRPGTDRASGLITG